MDKKHCLFINFLATLLLLLTTHSFAATLHAVIIADTNDWSIGESVKVDRQRVTSLFHSISNYTGLTLRTHDIYGNQLTYNKVQATLSQLSIGRDDVVFVYYTGHGGNSDQGTGWPFMDIKGGGFELKTAFNILKRKNPRFLLIIADTCNTFQGGFTITESRGGIGGGSFLADNYRKLFLDYQGYIMASSSIPGQPSWGNNRDGGFFTYGLLKNLNQAFSSRNSPNWHSIMKRAEAPIDLPGGKRQNPQTLVKIQPAKPGIAQPQQDSCYYFYKPGGVLCCRTSTGTTCDDKTGNMRGTPSGNTSGECPHYFMKPGGVLCCRWPTGVTCE
jgi:hypothetical protein